MDQNERSFSVLRERSGAVEIVRLNDSSRRMEVCLAPSIGNIAYSFTAKGKNVLRFPFESAEALEARPSLCGVPFLAPWANRIDGETYWANGRQFHFNPALQNLRRDPFENPIHGLLLFSRAWKLIATGVDDRSAYATSRLEFWRDPAMLAQFPFPHTITMTYRLADGSLAVETTLENYATEPLPMAIGFHPYFQLHDVPRDEWTVHLAAREHLPLDTHLIPTGARQPLKWADPHPLRAGHLDDVFSGLIRDTDGFSRFWVQGQSQRITVAYGPKYTVAVVYAPTGENFICFEPMAAVTNAFNLAHDGRYTELQSVAPGSEWRETFSITPTGF